VTLILRRPFIEDPDPVIRPGANRVLLAAILSLYGAITVSGPALHGLPGFAHPATSLGTHNEDAPGQAGQDAVSVHDCPICHFHAQGQLVADPDAGPCVDVVRTRLADERPIASPAAILRPSIPRAPPLA